MKEFLPHMPSCASPYVKITDGDYDCSLHGVFSSPRHTLLFYILAYVAPKH